MRTKTILIILAAFLFTGAAAPVTYTQGPDSQWRQQVDPATDPKTGAITNWKVTAFFHAQFTNDADPTDWFYKELGTAIVNCTTDAAKTVTFTYSGKSYTLDYGTLAAGMNAAGLQEWKQNPQKVK